MVKNISIIGCTGSVGRQTLEVIKDHPGKYNVLALAAYENIDLLEEQVNEFKPEIVAVFDSIKAQELAERLQKQLQKTIPSSNAKPDGFTKHRSNTKPCGTTKPSSFATPTVLRGSEGWIQAASHSKVDRAFFVSSGVSALPALYRAIESKKEIALANKEMIVEEGEKIMQLSRKNGVTIIPVDSEHSAIFQCLQGEDPSSVEKIILTCSGGPFYGKSSVELKDITCEQALNHPTWCMGEKISIDSATLMNKGFEIIEAKHLFGLNEDQIEVIIHPESIVHSFIQFKDGSVKAQLGLPDMKTPITYALSYPERIETSLARIDFKTLSQLTFLAPDFTVFQGPRLAHAAIKKGGNTPAALRDANDEAVKKFLAREIGFNEIYEHINAKTGL